MLIAISLLLSTLSWADTPEINARYETFKQVVESSQAPTIEALLPEIKSRDPEAFQNYLLAYRSRSLQHSSFQAPRAILTGDKPDLIFSFNGDPRHRGYKEIEVIAFNPTTDTFEFREITFQNGRPQFSAANPQKCLNCHQSASRKDVDPRPNWEPYNKWPGFYGSADDDVRFNQNYDYHYKDFYERGEDHLLIDELKGEAVNYDQFMTSVKPVHPRYSTLVNLVPKFNDDDFTLNTEFTKKVAVLNFRRLARLMKQEAAIYNFVKWSYLAKYKCSEFPLTQETIDYLKQKGYRSAQQGSSSSYKQLLFTDYINMFYTTMGVSTEDWSMDFKTEGGRFAFQERFGTPNVTWTEFKQGYEKYFSTDPELQTKDCAVIMKNARERTGSLEAVKALWEDQIVAQKVNAKEAEPLIRKCMTCHSGDSLIPHIPFGTESQLKDALLKEGYPRGRLVDEIRYRLGTHTVAEDQMPPMMNPTSEEREQFLTYIENLVGETAATR